MRVITRAGLLLACGLVLSGACSSDPSSARRNPNSPTGGTSGAGGGAASSAGGNYSPTGGGGLGSIGGTAGSAGTNPMGPVMTDFKRDDTAMSGLDGAVIDMLKTGGGSCTTQLVYPYEGTIFPGGLISPLFQWNGASEGAYVHVSYEGHGHVAYEFATSDSDPGQLRVPQDAWNEITHRSPTTTTPLHVKVSVLRGGSVDTCDHSYKIAPGVMKGAIYYNTYNAPSATAAGQGAIMRLSIGQPDAEVYLQYEGAATPGTGPCISCHSVSANGSYMAAALHNYSAFGGFPGFPGAGGGGKEFTVSSYALTAAPQPPPAADLDNAEFAAVYPDGSRILAMGNPQCTGGSDTFPRAPNNFPLIEGPDHAKVLDAQTGMELPATGLNADWYMWMPQFSPDGTKVVFNHAKPDGQGGTDRRELAVMDYDYASNTFSNLRVIASRLGPEPSLPYDPQPAGAGATPEGIGGCLIPADQSPTGALPAGACSGPCYPANPFFTPDSKGVVFWLLDQPDFTNAFPGRDRSSLGELWYADVETGETIALDNAMATLDPAQRQMNYFTTMLPVQVGGYFWMFWTSRRDFGNQFTGGDSSEPNPFLPPGGFPGAPGGAQAEASKKRIWVAAIKPLHVDSQGDVMANGPLTDPSFPGFYLEGQSASGNVRAFAALSPCVAAGTTCTSGLDCCTGYCTVQEGASEGVCTDEVPMCAKTNEKCETSEDCCPPDSPDEPQNICLGGFCGFVVVQ